MRRTIHINLIKDEEKVSSNPIRIHVMAPLFGSLILAGVLIWWGIIAYTNSNYKQGVVKRASATLEGLRPDSKVYDGLKERQAEIHSEMAQLESFQAGRLQVGAVLVALLDVVPETIQLTALEVPEPPRGILASKKKDPAAKKGAKGKKGAKDKVEAPPALTEPVKMNISGYTDSSGTLDALRMALSTGVFTNFIRQADVPAGAFKIDESQTSRYVFDINCDCVERKFGK